MHKLKLTQKTKKFILTLVSLLTCFSILITGVHSYAVMPDAAYLVKIQGNGLLLGQGASRNRQPARVQAQIRGNNILYVPGNGPWAYLGFIVDAPLDSAGLLVKAGPSSTPSEWSFPCTARGGFTIAWKRGSNRGCETGVKVQRSSNTGGIPNTNNNLLASRKLLAQAEDEVTIVPTLGESIIQTADTATGISINVLVGDVQVKSAKNPGGKLVKAGERYDYPQDTITPIDPNPIVNSPEMQDFLSPNNWSSPDIPQRVADGIAGQLGEMRTALGLGSPAIASNSGNNNNSGQSSINLSGTWLYELNSGYLTSPDKPCVLITDVLPESRTVTIRQQGNQVFVTSPDDDEYERQGTVSGNQFNLSYTGTSSIRSVPYTTSKQGVVIDENKITGFFSDSGCRDLTGNLLKIPFVYIRQSP